MFFFFFDWESIYEFSIVKQAFYVVCGKQLEINYYCSMERFIFSLIRRLDYRDKLKDIKSPLVKLYNTSYPKGDSAIAILKELELELADVYEENSMSEVEAEAVIYWIYRVYANIGQRRNITIKSLEALEELLSFEKLDFAGDVLFVKDKAEINVIDSFTQFCEEIEWIDTQKQTFFFRGHANASYSLLPSIMRKPKWMLHEKEMYNELRINCPGDFSECVSHLDYLVEMQHYGLPTRLLDVTQNPLVALYFTCESETERAGEIIVFDISKDSIKYPGSDVVSILASLPLLSFSEKEELMKWVNDTTITDTMFNKKAKYLLHEIKLEKPAFRDRIKKNDVSSATLVLSEKKNQRIIKQAGAFIVCGLFGTGENPINAYRYRSNGKIQIYIVTAKAKRNIKEQLDKFSINRATLFPEIEEVSSYIKGKYS